VILVRRRVLEELHAGPVADADHPDLLDDGARVDVHELRHEVAGWIAEGAERQRVVAAEHALEPRARRRRLGPVIRWSIRGSPGTAVTCELEPVCFGDQQRLSRPAARSYAIPFG
jgi:hypothetical protein